MPKLKQPSSLKIISFDTMIAHFVDRCDQLSIDGVSRRLRRQISLIKHHLHPRLLSTLFAEFCSRFLEEFYRVGLNRSESRPDGHNRVVLEVMMDLEIPGLKCSGDILRFLDLRDSHRLWGLTKLDLDGFWDHGPRTLANFRLQDLLELRYPRNCTDLDLEVVGQRCPRLRVLDVAGSTKVTDRGLRALSSCPELRVLDLFCCHVTDDGINELLSKHRKIEEFNIGRYHMRAEKSFDVLSRPISSACPSVRRFSLKSSLVTDDCLHAVVALFPNLRHIRICSELSGDICALKALHRLVEINFNHGYRCLRLDDLKRLIKLVGDNILVLKLSNAVPAVCLTQDDLDFFYKTCINIEHFEFDYQPQVPVDTLVCPPFRKLKTLTCSAVTRFNEFRALLEFRGMPELQILTIRGFDNALKIAEGKRFEEMPRLKQPIPLRKAGLERLAAHFVDHFDQLSTNWKLPDIRLSIAQIKEHVHPCLTPRLYNELCMKFLHKFLSIQQDKYETRPGSHNRAAIEVLMDVDIIGLQLGAEIIKYLNHEHAHRFRKLRILHVDDLRWTNLGTKSLGRFDLQYLTELHYGCYCADRDLEVVGKSCPKLIVLDIEGARYVTDRGLKALHPCSELRILSIVRCNVSDKGINELLSANKKISEFNFGLTSDPLYKPSFNILSRSRTSVCPSMKRFCITANLITDEHLCAVVELFPNLTHLRINGKLSGDLSAVRQLDKLAECKYHLLMDNFNGPLMSIGENITMLSLMGLEQYDLDFIHNVCVNIEYLTFHSAHRWYENPLVVPSFKKLKTLKYSCFFYSKQRLKFFKMPELEKLNLFSVDETDSVLVRTIESIMFDHEKFPNLKLVYTSTVIDRFHKRINQQAIENNLDFSIELN